MLWYLPVPATCRLAMANSELFLTPVFVWTAIHWKIVLFKFEVAVTVIPDKSGSMMKLNSEGRGSVWKELNWMTGPEGGVTTHSCCAGSSKGSRKKTVVQLKSTTSPGDAQASLGTVWKSAVVRWIITHILPCQLQVRSTSCLHCPAVV